MNVLVERYQRRKYVNQEDSQVLYYVRQKSGTVRVMDVNKLANAIEANSSLTAGDVKRIELVVRNTGSSLLKDIQLSANKPVDWEVSFEPSKIDMLKAGETANVVATMKASKKALPGDYVATMTAKTPEVNTDAQFRIAVKTPMIWGWVGVLIIIVAIGAVCYLFRKYGRR